MSKLWGGLPYLDVLRPDYGQVVDYALLSTYSADLVAVVASLLALSGLDDDRGSGSKVDFANAYDQLKDRVRILVQAGQLGVPSKKLPVLVLLDRFIKEIQLTSNGVWHPKLALVKFKSDPEAEESPASSKQTSWRLWLGSRNLSRSLDWDAGLVLTGGESGAEVPGIVKLAAELASRADNFAVPASHIKKELASVRWSAPAGVTVEDISLWLPSTAPDIPSPPFGLEQLWLVSPFLDGGALKSFGQWGSKHTPRTLLATLPDLAKMNQQTGKPLAKFSEILAFDMPDDHDENFKLEALKPDMPGSQLEEQISESDDERVEARGLHAKLILARHQQGYTLWLGSANATTAAWNGKNAEAMAKLAVSDLTIINGLLEFIKLATPVPLSRLPGPVIEDADDHLLDEARQQVISRWQVKQRRQSNSYELYGDSPPHPDSSEITLAVGLLTGDLIDWPRGKMILALPPVPKALETEFVQVRLTLHQRVCTWVQIAPLTPPPDEERDLQALARYLSPRAFLLWLRAMLKVADVGDGGGDWDTPPGFARAQKSNKPFDGWAPTLEEILKAWSRNPAHLKLIQQRVDRYLQVMQNTSREYSQEEQKILQEFENVWSLVRATLVEGQV